MSEISSHRGVGASHVLHIEEGVPDQHWPSSLKNEEEESSIIWSLPFLKKVFAELLGTYFLIFVGCAAITVDVKKHEVVTLPGIAIVWGLAVMVLVYSLGHISGAHFNPAVTVAFATCGRFPWKQVSAYVFVQVVGSTLANFTLRIIFIWEDNIFAGTKPSGSDSQSLAIEIIISLFLMFVISAVSTDSRAVSELTGLVVGATVVLNVMFAGPISGASMNPARSIGSAIVSNHYKGIWIYIVGPSCGTILGAWAYNMVRSTNKPLEEITKTARVSPFSRAANKALTL